MPTQPAAQKRPWWQRGPITALWLALLLTALAHTKPLIDSGLATEETRAALRALAIQFAILTGVMSVFLLLGTIPHKGHRAQLRAPIIAGIDNTKLDSQTESHADRERWSHLEGYKLASTLGFGLGITAAGYFLGPATVADGRITIPELALAALLFLATLWTTLSIAALPHLLRDASHRRLRNAPLLPPPDASAISFYTLVIGAPMAGAELLPGSLAYLWSRPATLLQGFRKASPDT